MTAVETGLDWSAGAGYVDAAGGGKDEAGGPRPAPAFGEKMPRARGDEGRRRARDNLRVIIAAEAFDIDIDAQRRRQSGRHGKTRQRGGEVRNEFVELRRQSHAASYIRSRLAARQSSHCLRNWEGSFCFR